MGIANDKKWTIVRTKVSSIRSINEYVDWLGDREQNLSVDYRFGGPVGEDMVFRFKDREIALLFKLTWTG